MTVADQLSLEIVSYPKNKILGLYILTILFYALIILFLFHYPKNLDFSSLYSAGKAILAHKNPYLSLVTDYLPTSNKMPPNLNPPFVIYLVSPLSKLSYPTALMLWTLISLMLGLCGAYLVFFYTGANINTQNLYLLYLNFFPVYMNLIFGQFGALIFFLLMYGYHCWQKNKDVKAGIVWGILIAMKFFPALLLFFAYLHKRYCLILIMLSVFIFLSFLPAYFNINPYKYYLNMFPKIYWYGESWNASIYGYIYRLLNTKNHTHAVLTYFCYISTAILVFAYYIKKLHYYSNRTYGVHTAFALTIVMMLLLSPLGWSYYFSILLFPLLLTYEKVITQRSNTYLMLFLLCLFLFSFPVFNIPWEQQKLLPKIGIYSFYFYGLCLLTYIMVHENMFVASTGRISTNIELVVGLIGSFSIIITILMLVRKILWIC